MGSHAGLRPHQGCVACPTFMFRTGNVELGPSLQHFPGALGRRGCSQPAESTTAAARNACRGAAAQRAADLGSGDPADTVRQVPQ